MNDTHSRDDGGSATDDGRVTEDRDLGRGVRAAPLKLRNYVGYAAGDAANSFMFILQTMFLLIFYTDVIGLEPAPIAALVFTVRLWTAVTDLVAGRLVDLTRTRWGRFHPWLVGASTPMLLTGVALFAVPRFGGDQTLQFAYIAVVYVLHAFFYSLVVIPYSSLASAMTVDPRERARLGVWRNIAPLVVMVLVTALVAPLFTELAGRPGEIERFFITVALLGTLVAYALYVLCVKNSPERYRVSAPPPTVRETVGALATNRPLVVLCASHVSLQTGLFTLGAMQAYYATYVLGDSGSLVWIIGATSASLVLMLPVVPRLVARAGKKRTFLAGTVTLAVIGLWLSVMPPSLPVVVVSFFAFGVAQNLVNALMWPFVADVSDYGEWRSGQRSDGGTVAVYFFFRRVSQALAGGLAGWGLALGGFVVGGGTQPDSALAAIRGMVGVIPAALALVGALVFLRYPLDDARHARIIAELGRG